MQMWHALQWVKIESNTARQNVRHPKLDWEEEARIQQQDHRFI
jgi:hypothetical protein